MGMYDNIQVDCACGHRYLAQTKLGPCDLRLFVPQDTEDTLWSDAAMNLEGGPGAGTFTVELKTLCSQCHQPSVALCVNSRLIAVRGGGQDTWMPTLLKVSAGGCRIGNKIGNNSALNFTLPRGYSNVPTVTRSARNCTLRRKFNALLHPHPTTSTILAAPQ